MSNYSNSNKSKLRDSLNQFRINMHDFCSLATIRRLYADNVMQLDPQAQAAANTSRLRSLRIGCVALDTATPVTVEASAVFNQASTRSEIPGNPDQMVNPVFPHQAPGPDVSDAATLVTAGSASGHADSARRNAPNTSHVEFVDTGRGSDLTA